MFNGFSAIEMLIKIASAKLPAFSKLADDAEKEFATLKSRPTRLAPDRAKSARKSNPSASKRSKSGAAGKA